MTAWPASFLPAVLFLGDAPPVGPAGCTRSSSTAGVCKFTSTARTCGSTRARAGISRNSSRTCAITPSICPDCIVDAELVACDTDGKPDFQALMRKDPNLCIWCFDLSSSMAQICGPGLSSSARTSSARCSSQPMMIGCGTHRRFPDPVKLLAVVEKMGLEGVVSKRAGRLIAPVPQKDWVKVKARGWLEANADRWEQLQRRSRKRVLVAHVRSHHAEEFTRPAPPHYSHGHAGRSAREQGALSAHGRRQRAGDGRQGGGPGYGIRREGAGCRKKSSAVPGKIHAAMLAINWAGAIATHVVKGAWLEAQEGSGLDHRQIGPAVAVGLVATHHLDDKWVQAQMCGGFKCREPMGLLVICHDVPCRSGHRRMMEKIGLVREWRLHISCKRHGVHGQVAWRRRPVHSSESGPPGAIHRADGPDAGHTPGHDRARELQEHRVGGSIDTSKVASPIVGFIFDDKGLMYNLTLEGSKISRMDR